MCVTWTNAIHENGKISTTWSSDHVPTAEDVTWLTHAALTVQDITWLSASMCHLGKGLSEKICTACHLPK